jgi:hypothetical protein
MLISVVFYCGNDLISLPAATSLTATMIVEIPYISLMYIFNFLCAVIKMSKKLHFPQNLPMKYQYK